MPGSVATEVALGKMEQAMEDVARRLAGIEDRLDRIGSNFVTKGEADASGRVVEDRIKEMDRRVSRVESNLGWVVKGIITLVMSAIGVILFKGGMRL